MLRAQRVVVPRGEAAVIPLDLDVPPGSPAPTLVFTLATSRNAIDKVWTGTPELASPGYVMTVPSDITNRNPCTYWWDVWDTDANRLLKIGSLTIEKVVRLP